ncbi:mechanosensitive ion channel family protein [Pseudothioclava nitratireducens]|uniref:mechanosensitive ion channel family protein n=1 Tax=Pseudothioclava nitratireducens TaxID=1928646 RepID=UPI0023DA6CF0|nr:mechanosensitive ion channel domain-containing protein [Defluviimonas nitratireducens]MDF1619520.1 mechanosensitive ion channel [Defluviimonas nitratireducens]
MDQLEQTFLSPLYDFALGLGEHLWTFATRLFTPYQFVAVFVAFGLALALRRLVRRLIKTIEARAEGRMTKRALHTAASISLPIGWVIGLWISLGVLTAFAEPTAMVRLFASLINAWVMIRILTTLLPSASAANVVSWTIWSFAALNAVGLLEPAIRWLDSVKFASDDIKISLWTAIQGVISSSALLWVAYHSSGFISRRLERSTSLSPTMRVLMSKLLGMVLMVLAVLIGMQVVGIDLTAFAFFSGALGLGVGLGMQRTVANLVAGFSMLADRSIKPGDVIEIQTGEGPTYGVVKSLAARYVSVRTRSGTETLIPNEILISNPVTNWSFSDRKVRRAVAVGIAYGSDLETAQTLCIEAARACPRVLATPAPVCLVRGFGESSVDMELRFWIADPEGGVANISSEIYVQIWKRFRESGIEIPFPQREVTLRHAAPEHPAPQSA